MFTFKDVTSGSMGVHVLPYSRVFHPAQRVIQTYVQGRSGTYDQSDDSYENGTISLSCVFFPTQAAVTLRDVAAWLVGSGELIFDDEPGKVYEASVYQGIDLSQQQFEGAFTIVFTVFPFPHGDTNTVTQTITSGGGIALTVGGTAQTPCVITIVNRSDSDLINNVSVTLSHEL